MKMRIRTASLSDRNAIRDIHMSAFPESERTLVSSLALGLLDENTQPETFSLVAEDANKIVGHIAFSPVFSTCSQECAGFILAPLAVKPEYHGRGIGSALIKEGLNMLEDKGYTRIFVYGDPAYYGRFGFNAEKACRFSPPYALQYPLGWQSLGLNEKDLGKETVPLSCVKSLCNPALW